MPRQSEEDSVYEFDHIKNKLTVILLKGEKVFGYYADLINEGKIVSSKETDELIRSGWKMFSKDSLVIIIKPTKLTTYTETIEMLDRMTTNQIERYSMADPNKKEKEFLKLEE